MFIMNGRRSQYKGGHTRAPAGSNKWRHKDDKADKGKGINEYMCLTDKDKTSRAHNCFDTWRDDSSAELYTPKN